jgi:leucyl-tRNA synthetase
MEYTFREVEQKWQQYWAKNKTFKTENKSDKPKYYVLDMFPYPSGAGLHVGHPLGYIASDIFARYKRLKGFNVLHPMGYDSFGLPAEQYAIQTGQHPEITTKTNIARYREQLDKIGFSFDWDREVRTSDPKYYKWTQWIFIQLFNSWYNPETNKAENISTLIEKLKIGLKQYGGGTIKTWDELSEKEQSEILLEYRLAYLSDTMVNWCPQLGTVLANEEVKDGVSERGGYPVERKLMKQWSLRITAYADRLLNDLDGIDWTDSIKEAQRNWIGKSVGTSIKFNLSPSPSPQERGIKENVDKSAFYTTDGQMWNLLISRAKEMRSNQTPAEFTLWEALRAKASSFKIRRQHIIDRFIVDFVCLSKKLVIEVDGDIHDYQKQEDEARTEVLNSKGFKVIRFRNEEVLNDINSVTNKIVTQLNQLETSYPNCESDVKVVEDNNEQYSYTPSSPPPSPEERGLGGEVIEVFTTRPDTIFGVSFVTLAPEHELVAKITTPEQKQAVEEYITFAKNRSERERMADVKKITGVFTGSYSIHPFTGKQVPIWIGDYVLAGYGTGAVMAVPAHDSRDFAFATHFGIEKIKVIEAPTQPSPKEKELNQGLETKVSPIGGDLEGAWDEKEGKLVNSDFLNGLEVKEAIKKAIAVIEEKGLGKGKTNFRLRDAIFGRQRYWGEPIPVYYKDGIPKVLNENELPLVLPEVDKYLPTETGEPPLARAKNWRYTPSPEERGTGGEVFEYEYSTMPGWAGSSWYFLRYMDANNDKEFISKEAANYWQNVDLYMGGAEHATGHLLYVRFWTKFLHDLGLIPVTEPAKKLINQGMIQGMSSFVYRLAINSKYSGRPNDADLIPSSEVPPIFISKDLYNKLWDRSLSTDELFALDQYLFEITRKIKEMYPKHIGEISYNSVAPAYNLHVDVNIVKNNVLDQEAFKNWREEYKNAMFYDNENKDYICGSEVEKMSKSKWNVVSPDAMVEQYGADCLRLYEMFLGPLELSKPWNTNGITGVSNFIRKLWRLYHNGDALNISNEAATKAELKTLHKTIKKITEDIERFSFNTSVSNFMICVNELTEQKCNKREILEPLAIIIAPYAPHIAEELWLKLGHTQSVTYATFPELKEEYLVESSFSYPISFNGKTRFFQEYDRSLSKEEVEKEVMGLEQTHKYLEGKTPKKVIVVHNKIVNIVM